LDISINAYDGILKEPTEIMVLDDKTVAGIHKDGGTIIGTTNKGGPFAWPYKNKDGVWEAVDRSDEMIRKLQYLGVDAVISIGGVNIKLQLTQQTAQEIDTSLDDGNLQCGIFRIDEDDEVSSGSGAIYLYLISRSSTIGS
jgi:6-phosphofructokinase